MHTLLTAQLKKKQKNQRSRSKVKVTSEDSIILQREKTLLVYVAILLYYDHVLTKMKLQDGLNIITKLYYTHVKTVVTIH